VADATRHALDGVRPKHTICPGCGYQHGGLQIKGGVITCPECGAAAQFDRPRLKASVRRPRPIALWLLLAIVMVLLVMGAVL
jgi:hypothetical protein